jgi:hypothetical protein
MVMHKCPKCGNYFSAPHYAVDYIHNCPDKVEEFERVKTDSQNWNYQGYDEYPFEKSRQQKRSETHSVWPVKKYIELR